MFQNQFFTLDLMFQTQFFSFSLMFHTQLLRFNVLNPILPFDVMLFEHFTFHHKGTFQNNMAFYGYCMLFFI